MYYEGVMGGGRRVIREWRQELVLYALPFFVV